MQFIEETLGVQIVSVDQPFANLGVDSLEFIELINALQERYGLKISDKDAAAFDCVQDIEDFIANRELERSVT
jgi:acyl carrier protein